MTDATPRERFDAAFSRIEAGIVTQRVRRERAEQRYAMLESASAEAVAALDALLATPAKRDA